MRWVRLTSDPGPATPGPSPRSRGVRFAKGIERPFALFAALTIALGNLTLVAPAAFAAFAATPVGLETVGIKDAGLAWADFNEDGCLDVIVTTENPVGPDQYTQLYRSDCSLPNPSFVNVTATHAPGLATPNLAGVDDRRQVVWGDVNNDGHVDLITQAITRLSVWINKGPAGVPPYGFGDAGGNPVVLLDMPDALSGFNLEGGGLLDYDGDGDLDIIMDNHDFGIDLWDNDGTGTFTWWTPNGDPNGIGLPEVAASGDYSAVGDFDGDGDVDILGRKEGLVDLWANTGGSFVAGGFDVAVLNTNKGAVAFCDFDDDGLFDIIWTDHPTTQVYRQGPVGTFTATGVPVVPGGSIIDGAACGDTDNDGDLDLFLTDTIAGDLLYTNTSTPGSITFGANTFVGGAGDGEGASFADYDNDGDLDVLISQTAAANELWRNDAVQTGAIDYMFVRALHDLGGGLNRDAVGATLQLFACDGVTALSGVRDVNGGRGHGSQDPLAVHFGLPLGSDRAYIVQAQFPTGETTQTAVVPSAIAGYRQTSVSNSTSDLSGCQIAGTVFEDVDGNLLPGAEAIGDGANPGRAGVDVRLYQDNGNAIPDGADTLVDTAVTGAGGSYTLTAGLPVDYWVVVDSLTVSPSAGIHASYLSTTPWAEQTYGPNGGWCADGLGGTAERMGVGPCFGGVDGATDDDASGLTTAEHIARVSVSGGVASVDFGFSFNVVTNLEPAWAAGYTASSYQGSLDQFIRNANAINLGNAMRFVPAVPTNADDLPGLNKWWEIDYTGSAVGETLADTHDADTTIDGTAFDLTDGVTVRDTNLGSLGANAAGGMNVGAGPVALPQVAKPELGVMRSDSGIGVGFSFSSNASTGQIPDNYTIRDLATWGFAGGIDMAGVPLMRPSGIIIERNVIGSAPDGFVDPLVVSTLRGVYLRETDGASVRNNLIGFLDNDAIVASDTTGTTISGNEVRESGQVDTIADGINHGGGSSGGTISGNLIVDSGAMGIDGTMTGTLIENNTITGSGQRAVQTGAIRVNDDGNTVRLNVLTGNVGPGVIVSDAAISNEVTRNDFGSNGGPAIDLVAAGGSTATGDGITPNDGILLGDSSVANTCGTVVGDGNLGTDSPLITSAVLVTGTTTMSGLACPNSRVEIYRAVAGLGDTLSGSDFGEGVEYLGFVTADGLGNWGPFVTAALAAGDSASAISVDSVTKDTSEFGPNRNVNVAPIANDDTPSTNEDTAVNVDVMANDTDADIDALQIDSFDAVSANGGTISLDVMGTPGDPTDDELVYDPPGDFNGSDTFDYTVSDGLLTDTATVNITIDAVNDEPSFTKGADVTVDEDSGAYLLGGGWATGITEGPADESAQILTFTVTAATPALFSTQPAVDPATGNLTFTPAANANGTTSVDIYLTDSGSNVPPNDNVSPTQTFNITITAINDEPSFTKGADVVVAEDAPPQTFVAWATAILEGPPDEVPPQTVSFNIVTNTNPGLFSVGPALSPTGTLTFTPTPALSGFADITIELVDSGLGAPAPNDNTSPTQVFRITVNDINDPPTAVDDPGPAGFSTDEDTSFTTADVLSNDFDTDGILDPSSVELDDAATVGTVANNANGTFDFDPGASYHDLAVGDSRTTTFDYRVKDDDGDWSNWATVTITVTGVNDAPVSQDVSDNATEDGPVVTGSFDSNDVDSDDDPTTLVYAIVTPPGVGEGAAALGAVNGTFDFDPGTDFQDLALGEDRDITFTYRATDSHSGVSNTATVTITVTGVNDAPVAIDDSGPAFNTLEDTPFTTGDVFGNDSDIDGTLVPVSVQLDVTGTIGTVINNADGTFDFSPAADWNGTTSFDYRVQDDIGAWSNWASVSVTVGDVNDPPIAVDDSGPAFNTPEDVPFTTGGVLGNDSDIDGTLLAPSVQLDDTGTIGTVTNNADGTFDFSPVGDWNGSTSFAYRVQDNDGAWSGWADVTVVVVPVNDPPAIDPIPDATISEIDPFAVTATGSDINGDPLTFSAIGLPPFLVIDPASGLISGTPGYDDSGVYVITVTVTGPGGLSASTAFSLTVLNTNRPPTGLPDNYDLVQYDTMVIGAPGVLSNDTDPDGDPIASVIEALPIRGTLTLNSDGSFTYAHSADNDFDDSFTYRVFDGLAFSEPVRVTLSIEAKNKPPFAVDDAYVLYEDSTGTFELTLNDSDPDGDSLFVTAVTAAEHGTLTIDVGGQVTYTPAHNYTGIDHFRYTISDGNGGTSSAAVDVRVFPLNDPPVGMQDFLVVNDYFEVNIQVLANDIDPDGDFLILASVGSDSNGSFVANADGTVTFRAYPGFFGSIEVSYRASDGKGGTDESSIFIVVPRDVFDTATDLSNEVGSPLINFDVPDGIEVLAPSGVELLTGAFFQSLETLQIPLILLLISLMWSMLLGGFRWSSVVRILPFLGGKRRLYAVVMRDPESSLPIYEEPGDDSKIRHHLSPTARDIVAISKVRPLEGIDWIEIEAGDRSGWVDFYYLTEQVTDEEFVEDERVGAIIERMRNAFADEGSVGSLVGERGLAIGLGGSPVVVRTQDIEAVVAGRSIPFHSVDFTEAIAEPFLAAAAVSPEPAIDTPILVSALIPTELHNFHFMSFGRDGVTGSWMAHFEYKNGKIYLVAIAQDR